MHANMYVFFVFHVSTTSHILSHTIPNRHIIIFYASPTSATEFEYEYRYYSSGYTCKRTTTENATIHEQNLFIACVITLHVPKWKCRVPFYFYAWPLETHLLSFFHRNRHWSRNNPFPFASPISYYVQIQWKATTNSELLRKDSKCIFNAVDIFFACKAISNVFILIKPVHIPQMEISP